MRLAMFAAFTLLVLPVVAAEPGFPRRRAYQHSCKITTEYDKARDSSTEEVDLGRIVDVGDISVEVSIVYFHDGASRKALTPRNRIHFQITGQAETWEFLKYREFNLLVDDVRIPYGEPEHDGSVKKGYVLEQMWVDTYVADILKLANAKTVEGKIGGHSFRLTPDQMTAVKDFASRLGVPYDIKEKQAREKAIKDEFEKVEEEATKAAQKLPKSKVAQRQRVYDKAMEAGVAKICERYKLTGQELKAIVGAE